MIIIVLSLTVPAMGKEVDVAGYIDSLNNLAGQRLHDQRREVLALAMRALHLSDSTGYPRGHVEALWRIGNYFYITDSLDQAIFHYERALRDAEKIGHIKVIAFVSYNLALVYQRLKLSVMARDFARRSVREFQWITREKPTNGVYMTWLIYAYNCLGKVCDTSQDYDSALCYYRQSLDMAERQQEVESIRLNLTSIGNVYRSLEKYDSSLSYYGRSKQLSSLPVDSYYNLENDVGICEAYFQKGLYAKAVLHAREAYTLIHSGRDTLLVSPYSVLLADLYYKLKHPHSAQADAVSGRELTGTDSRPEPANGGKFLSGFYPQRGCYLKPLSEHAHPGSEDKSPTASTPTPLVSKHFTGQERLMELEGNETVRVIGRSDGTCGHWISVLSLMMCVALLGMLLFIQKGMQRLTKANVKLKVAYHQIEEKQDELVRQNEELKCQKEEIKTLNNNLEGIVEERTSKLKMRNEQLNEFAFFNAHKLRSPITTILGLYGLLKFCQTEQERMELLQRIKSPVEELERLSHVSQRLLEENYRHRNDPKDNE